MKAAVPSAKTEKYDKEIDQLVYKMYGLSPDEIEAIEPHRELKRKHSNGKMNFNPESEKYLKSRERLPKEL